MELVLTKHDIDSMSLKVVTDRIAQGFFIFCCVLFALRLLLTLRTISI